MKLAGLRLRQRDGVTCGPSVAVMAGALLDPGRHAALAEPDSGATLFAAEQLRVHAEVEQDLAASPRHHTVGDGAGAHGAGVHGWGLLPLADVPRTP